MQSEVNTLSDENHNLVGREIGRILDWPSQLLLRYWYRTYDFLSYIVNPTIRKPELQWRYQPLPDKIREVKDKFLDMKLTKKRTHYRCRDNYVTLANIPKWSDYFFSAEVDPVIGSPEEQFDVNEKVNSKVSMWSGDITALEIDAIVNAAKTSLLGGAGVDGAIHWGAGRGLLDECRVLNGCSEGQAKITGGYWLPAKYVIHTVGPHGEKPEILRSCYLKSLELMLKYRLKSIAFPCLSTGGYGYPREPAAKVALKTVRKFLEKNSDKVDRVIFVVFLKEDKQVYEELMQDYFPLECDKL